MTFREIFNRDLAHIPPSQVETKRLEDRIEWLQRFIALRQRSSKDNFREEGFWARKELRVWERQLEQMRAL